MRFSKNGIEYVNAMNRIPRAPCFRFKHKCGKKMTTDDLVLKIDGKVRVLQYN